MIIVDANVIASMVVPSEHTALALRAFARDREWRAPLLWRCELRNVLATCWRRGALALSDALALFERAKRLVRAEYTVATAGVPDCAAATNCTAYDAEYAALAHDLGVMLVTADRELAQALPGTAVLLEAFGRRRH